MEGNLPLDLEAAFRESYGDLPYAIGFNQSGTFSVEEAQAYMDTYGGVDMMQFTRLGQRFDLVDNMNPPLACYYAVNGHFGSQIGRTVIVVPQLSSSYDMKGLEGPSWEVDQEDIGSLRARSEGRKPDDIVGQSEQGYRVVPPRYCAGFIDDGGTFYPNMTFMQ